MSLSHATRPDGSPLALPGTPPYRADSLGPLQGHTFHLPCGDDTLRGGRANEYLGSATDAWTEHPEWMDFLDLGSPAYDIKRAERDLYLHELDPHLDDPTSVLDFGCGIGRMSHGFLDRGATVYGVDGDMPSLMRFAWHAANREGHLDLFWSSDEALPDVAVDLLLAVEVLCYLADPLASLKRLITRLRPGGIALVAMEGRYGWAASQDAPTEGLDVALGGPGPLLVEGDRRVHLYDEQGMNQLIHDAGLEMVSLVPNHYLTDGPLESLLPTTLGKEQLLALEDRCRAHPVWAPLNRIWTAVARKPLQAP